MMLKKLTTVAVALGLMACETIDGGLLNINPDSVQNAPVVEAEETEAAPAIAEVQPAIQEEAVRGPAAIIADATVNDWVPVDPENTLYIDIPQGRIVVQLSPDLAQAHVEQVKLLAREGYYDGLDFYRVVQGFVAQGGDEGGNKTIRTAAPFMQAEFDERIPRGLDFTPLGNPDGYADQVGFINGFPAGMSRRENRVWLTHCTGAFAFGRGNERDSAATEFYITLQPQRYLDRNLTVFGRVIWGMEHVQAITRGEPGNGGVIVDRTKWTPIRSFRVAADVPVQDQLYLETFNTNSDLFSELIEARRNRPEDFFYYRPDYLDLCQMPLPVRLTPTR
ncbi:MAG: peptidylprolyl isomerase [Aquisalinus sp.]|nr:peptidylprolyl isomerase [Aquisalinus sp.]